MADASGHIHIGVRTAAVRAVAGLLDERAADADTVKHRARAVALDRLAWGRLGFELGLWAAYGKVRDGAEHSIVEITSFLQDAKDALHATADSYDQAHRDHHERMHRIHDMLDGDPS
jgi:hypothetical protein